jgi:hypothetical protein
LVLMIELAFLSWSIRACIIQLEAGPSICNPVSKCTVACEPAVFGARIDLEGTALTDGGLGCTPVVSAKGKILLVRRGKCGFTAKAQAAQASDAAALVVVNNVGGLMPMSSVGNELEPLFVPSVMIAERDAKRMFQLLLQYPDMTASLSPWAGGHARIRSEEVERRHRLLYLQPTNPIIQFRIGEALRSSDAALDAERSFRTALSLIKANSASVYAAHTCSHLTLQVMALTALGSLLMQQAESRAEAKSLLREALSLHPRNSRASFELAQVHMHALHLVLLLRDLPSLHTRRVFS